MLEQINQELGAGAKQDWTGAKQGLDRSEEETGRQS